jgi:N-acetylglucosaminyldiphosphoundecaprenol N-acetyl-beta-D-mannosaminyltransferase
MTKELRRRVLSLGISTHSYLGSLAKLLSWAEEGKSAYVCFANVHMTIEAYNDEDFSRQVNDADMVCADGMPLVKAIKLVYKQNIERVAGMDMMPSIISQAGKLNLSVYFYGSTNEILEKIVEKAKAEQPNLKVAGYYSPPFRPLSQAEELEIAHRINNSGARIVFVALGCPNQEKWMARNSKDIKALLLGVGGAFPVYINEQKRAPKWIRDLSLEWMYRLVQDPKRLFKRYFYTNTKFLFLFLRQFLFGLKT